MTIVKHELRQGAVSLCIWSVAISFLLAVCIFVYPDMASQMSDVSEMFSEMGGFSAAFGMDKISFGEFIGFFSVECGNVLGIGGAFFAALLGISALAKEEKEHTAEFLLTHQISRVQVITEKLCSVIVQVILLNVVAILVTVISIVCIGEDVSVKKLTLLFLAYILMQVEIAAITFGISAFIKRGSLGIGLGLAAVSYFLNIIANLTEKVEFLKYITPFGYTEGADIIANNAINTKYLSVGIIFSIVGVIAAYWKYQTKDIA